MRQQVKAMRRPRQKRSLDVEKGGQGELDEKKAGECRKATRFNAEAHVGAGARLFVTHVCLDDNVMGVASEVERAEQVEMITSQRCMSKAISACLLEARVGSFPHVAKAKHWIHPVDDRNYA
jgi:hypothetical protein